MIQGVRQFRDQYWERGVPGRDTPATLTRQLYQLWLVGLLLKLIGSSWDVSWHFKWLRDDLAPPHLINTVGTVIVVGLTLFHTFTGYGVDKLTLRLMQIGCGIFLVALPIDVINHRINGLDITSWSGSHALLYLGTAVMLAGAIRGWMKYFPLGTMRTFGLVALWFFFLENVWFPNQHQEYGVRALQAYDSGRPSGAVWENARAVMGGLSRRVGIPPRQLSSFHRDYTTQTSCPGWEPWMVWARAGSM